MDHVAMAVVWNCLIQASSTPALFSPSFFCPPPLSHPASPTLPLPPSLYILPSPCAPLRPPLSVRPSPSAPLHPSLSIRPSPSVSLSLPLPPSLSLSLSPSLFASLSLPLPLPIYLPLSPSLSQHSSGCCLHLSLHSYCFSRRSCWLQEPGTRRGPLSTVGTVQKSVTANRCE